MAQGRVRVCVFALLVLGLLLAAAPAHASPEGAVAGTIDAGGAHSCGLRTDGTVACWGNNDFNQSDPVPAGTFTQVSAGDAHSCAVRTDGNAVCWGRNNFNQTNAPATGSFLQVSTGNQHSCGIRSNGTLFCWGSPSSGRSTPPGGTFTDVSAGGAHGCAIRVDGAVLCWGLQHNGEAPPAGTFTDVTTGQTHSCAVRTDGSIACWGVDSGGQAPETVPGSFTQVVGGGGSTCALTVAGTVTCWGTGWGAENAPTGGGFIALGGGTNHTCAVRADGTAECWGHNPQVQPEAGTTFTNRAVDAGGSRTCFLAADGDGRCWGGAPEGALPGSFRQISSGGGHTCGVRLGGEVNCWGANGDGQAPPTATGSFAQVAAGGLHTCGLRFDGTVTCWGADAAGQAPGTVTGTYTQLAAGANHTCALRSDGTVACWGANASGQATAPTGTFRQLTAGGAHTCGVRADGSVACWGLNGEGQAPASLAGTYAQVIGGAAHSCALRADGTATCWGRDAEDQAPGTVAGTFTQVSLGDTHGCGIHTDGAPRCWGDNGSGTAGSAPEITSAPPPGSRNRPYDHAYTATGAPAPTFEVVSGNLPPGLTLDAATGALTGTPASAGTFTGVVRATNGLFGPPDEQPFSITIELDQAPTAAGDTASTDEDTPLEVAAPGVLDNDGDGNGDPLEATLAAGPSHGTVTLEADGSYAYEPEPDWSGEDSFTYRADDGTLESTPATVTITVAAEDDPPVPQDDALALDEDAGRVPVPVLANDANADGGPLNVAGVGAAARGTAALRPDGTVTYEPDRDWCGSDSFSYTANGGGSATVTVTVGCVDDGPQAVDDAAAANEDGAAIAIDVLANDTDADGGQRSVADVSDPAGGTASSGAGGVTYSPDPDFCGSDAFEYELNGGSTATVTVSVSCEDDRRAAADDEASVGEDSAATRIDVLENDTDVDGGPGDVASVSTAGHGTTALVDGEVRYRPEPDFCGGDAFGYVLEGGSEADVTVTVGCSDDAPHAADDTLIVLEDADATAIDVLVNDADVDGGPKAVESLSEPPNGAATLDGDRVTYRPAADHCGRDAFSYRLNGGARATVAVTVTCVEETPVEPPAPPALSIARRAVRLEGRRLELRVACVGEPGMRCQGAVKLRLTTGRKPSAGSRRIDVATGQAATIAVKPKRAIVKLLRRRGRATVTVIAQLAGAPAATTAERRVTVARRARARRR